MRSLVALVCAVSLAASPVLHAGDTAVVTGRVLPSPDIASPATRVWVGDTPTVVSENGTFRAEGIPAGKTQLAIETSEGLYLVPTPLTLAPGATRSVQLAFAGRQGSSLPPSSDDSGKKRTAGGIWANPLYATLIVVGSAIVVGVAVDQLTKSDATKEPASPSAPSN